MFAERSRKRSASSRCFAVLLFANRANVQWNMCFWTSTNDLGRKMQSMCATGSLCTLLLCFSNNVKRIQNAWRFIHQGQHEKVWMSCEGIHLQLSDIEMKQDACSFGKWEKLTSDMNNVRGIERIRIIERRKEYNFTLFFLFIRFINIAWTTRGLVINNHKSG